jgi:hypothetical protein
MEENEEGEKEDEEKKKTHMALAKAGRSLRCTPENEVVSTMCPNKRERKAKC